MHTMSAAWTPPLLVGPPAVCSCIYDYQLASGVGGAHRCIGGVFTAAVGCLTAGDFIAERGSWGSDINWIGGVFAIAWCVCRCVGVQPRARAPLRAIYRPYYGHGGRHV